MIKQKAVYYSFLFYLFLEIKTYYDTDEGGNVYRKITGASRSDKNAQVVEMIYQGDRITSYNGEEVRLYDECGNPEVYRNKEMTWTRGRLMAKCDGTEYAYDKDGRRSAKNLRDTRYIYDGDKLVSEKWNESENVVAYNYYIYDGTGLAGFFNILYNGEKVDRQDYIIITDTFGTVREIRRRQDNSLLASFSYDPWGKCTVVSDLDRLKSFPFRWKGYYYDVDTGFYLIPTASGDRWYDPETGRFISSAGVDEILAGLGTVNGLNPYMYSLGDHVNAAGSAATSESGYELTSMQSKRYTKRKYLLQKALQILQCVVTLITFIVSVVFCVVQIAIGVGAMIAGGVGGIIFGTVTILASAYTIADSVASLCEAFSGNGYNFMRDGLYGGNAKLHKIMAIVAAVVMTVGSIASVASIKYQAMKNAKECLNGTWCFKAGTLVLCMDENGEECRKPIEDVEVGDLVWSYDEETGESDWKPVLQLFRNKTESWCHVHIEGTEEPIVCTPGHKFYVPDNKANRNADEILEHASYAELSEKWVSAEDLKKGDKVLLSDGKYGIITKTQVKRLSASETTYNFEVADFHTYYVGKNSVCVHNAKCGPTSPKKMNDNYLKKNGIDPHSFKADFVGKPNVARYDIFIDKVDDMLWLGTKHNPTIWIETFTKFGGL